MPTQFDLSAGKSFIEQEIAQELIVADTLTQSGERGTQSEIFEAPIVAHGARGRRRENFMGDPSELPRRRRGPQTFRLGDTVRVLSGPFPSFPGKVEGINQAKRLLKVRIEIFGRVTDLKLVYADVETVSFK